MTEQPNLTLLGSAAPVKIVNRLMAHFLNRVVNDNKGEVDPTPAEPSPTEPPTDQPPAQPPAQPSAYDEMMAKKGFKSNDDLAKSYGEAESALSREQNSRNTTKTQLEKYGYTLDDKGNVVTVDGQPAAPPAQPAQPGYQPGQPGYQPQQTVYDPYTGEQLTNPIDIQLANLPPSQRIGAVVNVMLQQNQKFQSDAFNAEQEVLNRPDAKGFEKDVRAVMAALPPQIKAKKESWEDALLKVKGAKYDEAMKNAGEQGVNAFLNKAGNQGLPESGTGGAGGPKLTPEQEESYKYYQQNHPGMFKDKAHFLARCNNTG